VFIFFAAKIVTETVIVPYPFLGNVVDMRAVSGDIHNISTTPSLPLPYSFVSFLNFFREIPWK